MKEKKTRSKNIKEMCMLIGRYDRSFWLISFVHAIGETLELLVPVFFINRIVLFVSERENMETHRCMYRCMYLCVLCCALFLASKFMQKKSDFSMDNSITKIRMGLQKALHQKMIRMEYSKLEDEAFWKRNQRIFHMLDTSESEVGLTLRQIYVFCGLFVTLIISLGMMIKIDISGILLAAVVLLSCVPVKKEILFERKRIEEKDVLSKKSEYIFEVSNNTRYAKDLRLLNAWDTLKKKIDHLSANLYEIDKESNHLKYKKRYLLEHALYMIYFIVYMVRLLIKYSNKTVDFDIVITAFFLTAAVGNIFFMMMESGVMFGVNMKGIMSFIQFLREKANPKTGGSQAAAGNKNIEWELKNVSYCYPNRRDRALNMINLNIYGKEKIAVVGLNGAGKSTLIKCMTGLYTDFSGSIFYKGESIRDRGCDPAVCVLYQDADIYPFSIGENVSSMDPDMDTGRVYEALEKVGLSKILEKENANLQTYAGKLFSEDGLELSGGEKQKLLLSRMIYSRADTVILDETTSNMDVYSEMKMIESILDMFCYKTVIFITHSMSLLDRFDRVIVLEGGYLAEEGTYGELMQKKGRLYRLVKAREGVCKADV